MELQGKISVITGGTSGIGLATVERFAEEGAKVIFCGRREDKGKQIEEELNGKNYPGSIRFFKCDVSKEEDIRALADFVKKEYGNCEVLFNNAGVHLAGKLHETKPADWDRLMSIDVRGVYLANYYFLPQMLEAQYGTIVNMASISGLFAEEALSAYNTAKGAIVNMTRNMALDYAKDGIRVNAVCPGITYTEISKYTFDHVPGSEQAFIDCVPIKRIADPVEIANVVVFLASRKCDFMTGVNIPIDGGVSVQTGHPNTGTY